MCSARYLLINENPLPYENDDQSRTDASKSYLAILDDRGLPLTQKVEAFEISFSHFFSIVLFKN